MTEQEKRVKLGSIHYDFEDLRELERVLTEDEEVSNYSVTIHEEDGSRQLNTVADLKDSRNMPDEVRDFYASTRVNAGRISVTANDQKGIHVATITGDRDWVLKKKAEIEEFARLRRDWFGSKKFYLTVFQSLAAGFLLALYQEQLTAIFVSFYYYDAALETHLTAAGIILFIVFLQFAKSMYPFVAIEIEPGGLRYKKLIGYASGISTLILSLGAILQIIHLL